MTKKKDTKHVNPKSSAAKKLPREVIYLGPEKEIESLTLDDQVRLKTILHTRVAHEIEVGVPTEVLQGAAKGTGLIELKIKSKESIRCFYSLKESGLVLVAIVFVKKQNDQADKEIRLAVKRIKDFKRKKK